MKNKLRLLYLLILCSVIHTSVQAQYCTPGFMMGCGWATKIESFYTSGGVTQISNLGTFCESASGYADYSEMSCSQMVGDNIIVSFKLAEGSGYVKLWVDWNEDEEFNNDDELVFTSPYLNSFETYNYPVAIPAGTIVGEKRMRIIVLDGWDGFDACLFDWVGEAEDYTLEVLNSPACVAIPTGIISIDGIEEICPSTEFMLSIDGLPATAGLTKVWQKRTVGSTAWETIPGAEFSNLVMEGGISVNTEFRVYVRCGTTVADTSAIHAITLSNFGDCYCEPIPGMDMGCVDFSTFVNSVQTTGGIENIENLETGCSGDEDGYVFYDDMKVKAYQGNDFILTVTPSGSMSGVRAWADWNHDGTFSEDELLITSDDFVYSGLSAVQIVSVPEDALAGETRIRVRAVEGQLDFDACEQLMWTSAEVEDYILEVVPVSDCDEIVDGELEIIGEELLCSGEAFVLQVEGSPSGLELIRGWQYREGGISGTWVTIAGATSNMLDYTSGISVPTDFRYFVTCDLSGETDTSAAFLIDIKAVSECYCEVSYFSPCDDWSIYIDNVNTELGIANIANDATGCPLTATGYSDYTDQFVTTTQGGQFQLSVTLGSGSGWSSGQIKAWVDWNADGMFSTSELVYTTFDFLNSGETHSMLINVPLDAVAGNTRMRIRTVDNSLFDACDFVMFSSGEVEDYKVVINEAQSCSDVLLPATIAANVNTAMICGTTEIILDLETTMPIATNFSYQWKGSETLAGPYVNEGAPITNVANKHLSISDSRYFFVQILCEGEPVRNSDTLFVEMLDMSEVVIDITPGQSCGPGIVTLSASAPETETFWYTDAVGGTPIFIGNDFETPFLTTSTDYYVTSGAFPTQEIIVGETTGVIDGWNGNPLASIAGAKQFQYLYKAEDILASGDASAGYISKLSFYVSQVDDNDLKNYSIKYKMKDVDAPFMWSVTGFSEVFNGATVSPTGTGWYDFNLDQPMIWNGVDDIVLSICFDVEEGVGLYPGSEGRVRGLNSISGQAMMFRSDDEYEISCDLNSGTYINSLPNIKFTMEACEAPRSLVTANIRPEPADINLGPDDVNCINNNDFLTLSTGPVGDNESILWSTGAVVNDIQVNSSGTYFVTVTNEFECYKSDTVQKVINFNPIVELPEDTVVCVGGEVILDAGPNGIEYYWNNGKETRTVTVLSDGRYNVVVINEFGCMTLDTTNVIYEGAVPTIDGIVVTSLDDYSFDFKAVNPENVLGFEWDFGDFTGISNLENPEHTYATAGDYLVSLKLLTDCGGTYVYTTTTHIVSIGDLTKKVGLKLYPNPANHYITVEIEGNAKIQSYKVFDATGKLYTHQNNMDLKQYRVDLSGFASGIYILSLETDQGVIHKKFEVLK